MNDGQGAGLGDLRGRACCRATRGCATSWTPRTASTRSSSSTRTAAWRPRVIGSIVEYLLRAGRPGGGHREDGRSGHPDRLAHRHRGRVQLPRGHRRVRRPTTRACVHDLEPGAAPQTTFGLVTEALARRRQRGVAAVHGDVLRQHPGQRRRRAPQLHRVRPAAATRSSASGSSRRCGSPTAWSTGSPRSPPTTTAPRCRSGSASRTRWPVVCEPFTQWVLEDDFGLGRPPLEDAGVAGRRRRRAVRADEAAPAQRQPPGAVLLRLPGRLPAGARRVPGPAVRRVPAGLHGPGGHADAARRCPASTWTPTSGS